MKPCPAGAPNIPFPTNSPGGGGDDGKWVVIIAILSMTLVTALYLITKPLPIGIDQQEMELVDLLTVQFEQFLNNESIRIDDLFDFFMKIKKIIGKSEKNLFLENINKILTKYGFAEITTIDEINFFLKKLKKLQEFI